MSARSGSLTARLDQIRMARATGSSVNQLSRTNVYQDIGPVVVSGTGTNPPRGTKGDDVTGIARKTVTQEAWLMDPRLRKKVKGNAPRRRFFEWVAERATRKVPTPHTAEIAAEYVRSLNEGTAAKKGEGWKGEALQRQINNVKYGFKDTGLDGSIWESAEVVAALNRARLTIGEIREEAEEQRNKEKYEAHFKLMRTLFLRSGAEGFVFETASSGEVDRVLLYVLAYLLFDIGVRGGNLAATDKEKELTKQEGIKATNSIESTWVKNLGHLSLLKD